MGKVINAADYRWYQCDIVRKDGGVDFWCRFIATSLDSAKERIRKTLNSVYRGDGLKSLLYSFAEMRYIASYRVYRVPDEILKQYDLNSSGETDAFYQMAKG